MESFIFSSPDAYRSHQLLFQDTNAIKLSLYVNHAISILQQIKNTFDNIISTRYISLQYELLLQLPEPNGHIFTSVSALQDHYQTFPGRSFPVQQQEISPESLEASFHSLLLSMDSPKDGFYDAFISYRQQSDREHTAAFFNTLTALPIGQTGEHASVFYDDHSLQQGRQFDQGFMRGLCQTRVFVPFVTAGMIECLKFSAGIHTVCLCIMHTCVIFFCLTVICQTGLP